MSMADRDGLIWLDGEMVPWREAKVHVLTHTLHYGLGVFEGIRAYPTDRGVAIFRLAEHTRRLFDSAHILGMNIPWNQDTVNAVCRDVVRENGLKEGGYIRPMCFYGSEGMGIRASNLRIHMMVAAWQWPAYLGEEGLKNGIRVKVSSLARHHINSTMCKAKANGNYINSTLALHDAVADGYDEALLLDPHGYVAEGTGENLFIVRDGVLSTPTLTSVLDGITRKTIMQFIRELGLDVRERHITRDEVYIADEAFFTGTAAEVTPIREIDNRIIGHGTRGPITEKLQTLYFDQVYGRRQDHNEWLTLVED